MWKWPIEVVEWLRENTSGRTTKELTELMNQQGFDRKYGMVFTESIVKGAKSRYGFKSGTPSGNPKGYSAKYPNGMEEFIKSIAESKSTAELVAAVNEKFGAGTIGIRQMKAYKKNHGINTGLTGQFEPGHIPVNKGKKMAPEVYAKVAPTMFKKERFRQTIWRLENLRIQRMVILSRRCRRRAHSGRDFSSSIGRFGKNTTVQSRKERW